ncbi:hypothetical protein J2046_002334 [Rhizobium petrolearium]|uniref:cysteine rich repeat-containing protein n=1 Tax=Neorhizobium petrolearium TaxID=515361 RepID=UPI001AE4FC6C|nr:cysteine rich repeat-containing protein [Neorhizobium petrolearium]MBP1844076.1 hypothetical protein [Neorhizobium petrolearium]
MIRKILFTPTLLALFFATLAGTAPAQTQVSPEMRQMAIAVARACRTDLKTYCNGVERGEGRIAACLRQNAEKLSSPCRTALADVAQR